MAQVHDTVTSFASAAAGGLDRCSDHRDQDPDPPSGSSVCHTLLYPRDRAPCDSQKPRHTRDVGTERGTFSQTGYQGCRAGRGGSDTFSPRTLSTCWNWGLSLPSFSTEETSLDPWQAPRLQSWGMHPTLPEPEPLGAGPPAQQSLLRTRASCAP